MWCKVTKVTDAFVGGLAGHLPIDESVEGCALLAEAQSGRRGCFNVMYLGGCEEDARHSQSVAERVVASGGYGAVDWP